MCALVEGRPLDDTAMAFLDGGYDLQVGEFLPRHPPLPIVWEQRCPACDSMFVETNLIVAALLDSHSNSSAEEYTVNYRTKEGAGLKCATSMMLTEDQELEPPTVISDFESGTLSNLLSLGR